MTELDRQHQALIEGLVGQRWRGLYLNSAEFHAAVEALAALLPLWIDAIAAQSEKNRTEWAAELQRMQEARTLHFPNA